MSEQHLSDLAMLSIENEHARELDIQVSYLVDILIILVQEKARKQTMYLLNFRILLFRLP